MKNISFVIPAYNCVNTLEETVNSIFLDNFEEGDEIIIVDDASTDETPSLIKKLIETYKPHIKVLENKENKGCPATRNVGIREAQNPYILSLDSDNVLEKNSIKILRDKITETHSDIVTFGEIHFFNKTKEHTTHAWIFKKGLFTLSDLFAGNYNPGPVGNYLFTKEGWNRVNGFSELEKGLHEAWIFTFKQLISGSKIYICESGFYHHRYGHESLTIREYKRELVEKNILTQALKENLDIFDLNTQKYIEENTPQWIHSLNKKPLKIIGSEYGINGKLKRTWYGIYNSLRKKLKL
ncbi:MAG: hypothetical protein RLY43_303 [Bacteroidota bacterium]|jgi:glycosyltransferase involved in cell wall biosynthesis